MTANPAAVGTSDREVNAGAPAPRDNHEGPTLWIDLMDSRWPSGFRAWVERLAQQSDPADPLAGALVERLAVAAWRLRGLTAIDLEPELSSSAVQRDRLRARAQADRDFSRALADLIRYRRAAQPAGRTTKAIPDTAPERPAARRARRPEPTPPAAVEPTPTDGMAPDIRDETGLANGAGTPSDRMDPTDALPPSLAELAGRAPADWARRFEIDPAVSPHWPVVRGTRRLAETVASALVSGPTLAAVRSAFADLALDDLAAVARLELLGRTGPWPPGLEDHADGPGPSR